MCAWIQYRNRPCNLERIAQDYPATLGLSIGCKMRGAIVLLMVGLLTSTEARANDFVDRTWPFFQRYAECAVSHFHKLGWKSKKPFDEIEGTVAPVCGGHIDRMRQEMSRLGISSRKEQNVFIRRAYDGVVASFEDAYFASQYMEWIISEDETGQRWFHCLKVFAVTVAETTDEPAETIANAAMHSCRNERQSFMALLENVPRVWKNIAEEDFFTPLQEDFRQEIIAEILTMRAKAKLQ